MYPKPMPKPVCELLHIREHHQHSIKDKEKKCVVEASFEISKYNLKSLFEDNDLDFENTTIIRREILPSGKSRAFINDTPVNLSELQLLAENLIDIHSQHQTRELEQQNYQISISKIFIVIINNKVILWKKN